MVKQTGPIQEVSRALDLVPYLSTHSHISLKALAKEFNLSEKEMAQELTTLSMCGLPGYTPYELIEIFFDSGFVSINNHEALDIPRALSKLEMASLLIGLELIKDSAVEAKNGSEIKVLSDIEELISQLRGLIDGAIDIADNPQTIFRSVIEGAIAARTTLRISYLSSVRDELSIREVTPLSLYSEGALTYLSAYCHLAKGYRNFRLDRCSEVINTGESGLEVSPMNDEDAEVITADLQITQNRRSNAELLQLAEVSAAGEATIEVFSAEWLARAALSASPEVRITQPASLAGLIRESAQKILALYLS